MWNVVMNSGVSIWSALKLGLQLGGCALGVLLQNPVYPQWIQVVIGPSKAGRKYYKLKFKMYAKNKRESDNHSDAAVYET